MTAPGRFTCGANVLLEMRPLRLLKSRHEQTMNVKMVFKKSDCKILNCLNLYKLPTTIATIFGTVFHCDMIPHSVIF